MVSARRAAAAVDAAKKRKLEPPKPKRPMTAYLIFIKEFMKDRTLKSTHDCRKAMKEGAKRWREMSKNERSKYESKSLTDRQRFESEKEEYSAHVNALKCPRNPYAAFIMDYYACEFGPVNVAAGRFEENSRAAAAIWQNLDAERKEEYSQTYRECWNRRNRLVNGQDELPQLSYSQEEEYDDEFDEDDVQIQQNVSAKGTYSKRNSRSYKIEDIMQEDLSPKDERDPGSRKNSNNKRNNNNSSVVPSSSTDGQENNSEGSGSSRSGKRRSLRKRKGNQISYSEKKPRRSSRNPKPSASSQDSSNSNNKTTPSAGADSDKDAKSSRSTRRSS